MSDMIPVGYMAKIVQKKPDWIKSDRVHDIYSVSSCVSEDFCDYINYCKHNGYWFFDSIDIIEKIALENKISLNNVTFFYYECYHRQYDPENNLWESFCPEESLQTNVLVPNKKDFCGYDIVNFYAENGPECSFLSCNSMADEIETNKHFLMDEFDAAKLMLEQDSFKGCEPGPCRIFAVYKV